MSDAPPRPPAATPIRAVAALVCAGCLGAGALAAGCLLSIDESKLAGGGAADVTVEGDAPSSADGQVAADGPAGDAPADTTAAGDARDVGIVEAGCPTGMAQVPAPGGGKAFCVDATEVTSKAYKAFVAAADPPASGSQITECAWNTSYSQNVALGADAIPVGGLDWCDAYAYCVWAGKRLCGAVGGGPLDFESYLSSQSPGRWFDACSKGGTQTYPYAGSYQPKSCNGAPLDAGGPAAVGSLTTCEGGYPGLFDMSGNVAEFLDGCSTTPDPACGTSGPECDLCLLVGGSFITGAGSGSDIACGYSNQVWRRAHYSDNGLRCCADLP